MKKNFILIFFLNISVIFSSDAIYNDLNISNSYLEVQQLKYGKDLIPVGEIDSSIDDIITLKPDTVEFSITLETEGATQTEASNLNVDKIKNLKSYLSTLNITDDNLVTVDYRNSVKTVEKKNNKENTNYEASLKIVLTTDNDDNFIKLNKILDKYGINDISLYDRSNNYLFTIDSVNNDASKAKEDLYQKYTDIVNKLKKIGLINISIKSSSVREIDPGRINEKRYFVINTLKIKLNKFEHIGKIIAKAQDLKMQVNNNISYSVSPEVLEKSVKEHEGLLLKELTAKVEHLMGKQYIIGAPITLELKSQYHETSYQRNNYYHTSKRSGMSEKPSMDYEDVDINTLPEYEIILTLSGRFETLKKAAQN